MLATSWLEAEIAKWAFTSEVMSTRPSAWYVALHTADPTNSGASNEVFAAWYARKPVTFSRTNGVLTNTAAVTFDAVTGGGLTITHITIKDALSGGNSLAYSAQLGTGVTAAIGDVFEIAIGALTITAQ